MAENLTIETLEVVIERNSTDAAKKLDALIVSLNNLKTVTAGRVTSNLSKIASGIETVGNAINKIDLSKIEKLNTLLSGFGAVKGVKKAADEITESMTNMGISEDSPALANTEKNLKQSRRNIISFQKALNGLKKVGDTAMAPFNKIFKSMARIAMYRAIRTFFSTLTKAIKEGIQNLYEYDSLLGGNFANSLDKVSTSINYLKNSLGAALGNVLIAFTPMIESAADALAEFGNGIAVLVAKSQGLSTVTVAAKGMKEFAENAKKAKSSLMGFDELNQIGKDNNISSMFESLDISGEGGDDTVAKFKQKVATITAIATASMFALGAIMLIFGQIPLGIGLLLAGFSGTMAVAVSWGDAITPKIKSVLAEIMGIVGAASLALGAVLAFTGAALPLGIGLMVAGLAGTVASLALNWDFLKQKFTTLGASLLSIVSSLGAVIGFLLLFVPGMLGIGLGLLYGSYKGTQKAVEIDENALTSWIARVAQNAVDMVSNAWDNVFGIINKGWEKVKEFFTVTVKNFFVTDIPRFFRNVGINIANAIIDGLNRMGTFTIPGFKIGAWKIWDDTPVKLFDIPKIPAYATGGFPEDGLFMANSNEVVGQFGNGKTAVANNDQIIEGISQGVYTAVVSALSSREDGREIELKVYLDGKQIKASYDRTTYDSGVKIATGGIMV